MTKKEARMDAYIANLPNGVFTASLTPLKKDLSVDYEALIAHCKWLIANGGDGILLLGTTGEANSFTLSERFEIIDKVLENGIPPNSLMVGTGCCASDDTIALTKHAVKSGVGGILMLPPFYYKQVSDHGLMKYFDRVINGLGGGDLKIYLYHFPQMSGIPFSMPLVQKLVEEFPDIVVGMKDSSGDWDHMREVLRTIPGFKLYAGTERYLLDILKIGGVGCISATANLTVSLAAKVFQIWKSDGDTDGTDARMKTVRAAFENLPMAGALKSLLAKWTGRENWLNIRPPNTALDPNELETLESKLKALDFKPDF